MRRLLANTLSIMLVMASALSLLLYVGYGEAYKTYPFFQFDKIKSLGEIINNSLKTFLGAGLPLNQFPGFSTLTTPLLESEAGVVAAGVTDKKGQIIFSNSNVGTKINDYKFQTSVFSKKTSGYILEESNNEYRISLNVRSKFEDIGYLWFICPKKIIEDKIRSDFFPVLVFFVILMICYTAIIIFAQKQKGDRTKKLLTVSYGLFFVAMSAAVIYVLINIYTDGILGKTEALADSLGQRINKALELGLGISDFSGLDDVFNEYKENNPDMSFVSLTVNDQINIHTDPKLNATGLTFQSKPNNFEYKTSIHEKTKIPARTNEYNMEYVGKLLELLIKKDLNFGINLGIPKKIVYARIWRNAKNFVVLFVASSFMAALFLNLMVTFQAKNSSVESEVIQEKLNLDIANPIFFLSTFMEGLNVSFLPQHFRDIATASGLSSGMASTLFTVFFAAYAIALVPSGRYAESHGVRKLMITGLLIASASMLLMIFVYDYYSMLIIRFLCGIGQGMLFIGVQSFIIKSTSQKNKTQGAAVIVLGYNGGMISGSAIGALLVINLKTGGIFLIGAIIGLFLMWYIWKLMPEIKPIVDVNAYLNKKRSAMSNLILIIKDINLMKTIFLVGITTKAVLTGVAIFAMPLILAGQGYVQEDIGQIFMFYSAGVLMTSHFVSKIADRIGRTGRILFWGTQGSGLGLMLIGLIGWTGMTYFNFEYAGTTVLITGMLLLGLSHGFINAPIVTHVANTKTAEVLGATSTTSIYRLLERIGHVIGPMAVSQLLSFNNNSPMTVSYIGIAILLSGLIFIIGPQRKKSVAKKKSQEADL